MSPKDTYSFDFTDFWISYLNGSNGLVQNDHNEMDENPKLIDDDQIMPHKG